MISTLNIQTKTVFGTACTILRPSPKLGMVWISFKASQTESVTNCVDCRDIIKPENLTSDEEQALGSLTFGQEAISATKQRAKKKEVSTPKPVTAKPLETRISRLKALLKKG